MGVLTDFVLADVTDAQSIADSQNPVATWGGFSTKGVMSTDLCALFAVLRGEDPDQPVSPPRTFVNPFTKQAVSITNAMAHQDEFEHVAQGTEGEATVERLPDELLQRIATTEEPKLRAFAAAWAESLEDHAPTPEDAHTFLVDFAGLARRAITEGKSVLLWTCP